MNDYGMEFQKRFYLSHIIYVLCFLPYMRYSFIAHMHINLSFGKIVRHVLSII